MTSLARMHEFHFRHSEQAERRSESALEREAHEARDIDEASSEGADLFRSYGPWVGVAVALAALGLGAATVLGYIQAPALNPGPEAEPLTSRWQPDAEVPLAFAKATPATAAAPAETAMPVPVAERPQTSEPPTEPQYGPTDNPY